MSVRTWYEAKHLPNALNVEAQLAVFSIVELSVTRLSRKATTQTGYFAPKLSQMTTKKL